MLRAAGGCDPLLERVKLATRPARRADGDGMTSTTTSTTWVTIDEAAALLGISGRQVQRRVAAGQMQTLKREDGRTLVEVPASDTASGVALQLHEQADASRRLADLVERSTAAALAQVEARLAEQADGVRRWRRAAVMGWAAAGLALAATAATVSWGVMASDARATLLADRDAARSDALNARRQLTTLQTAMIAADDRESERAERTAEALIRALGGVPASDTDAAETVDCPTGMSHYDMPALGG